MSMLEIISINSISLDLASPANNECSSQQQQQPPSSSPGLTSCISSSTSPTGTPSSTNTTSAISETTCELTGKMNDTKSPKIINHHLSLPNRCTSSHTNITTIGSSNNNTSQIINNHNNNNNNNHKHISNGNATLHFTTNASNGNGINTIDVSAKNSSLQPHQKSRNRKNVFGQQQLSPFTFIKMPKSFIPSSNNRNAISVSSLVSPNFNNTKYKICDPSTVSTKETSQVTPSTITSTNMTKPTCTTNNSNSITSSSTNNTTTTTTTTTTSSCTNGSSHCRQWVQCSGHEGVFSPSDKGGTILKKVSSKDESFEVGSYIEMSNDEHARSLIPKFYSKVIIDDEEFIEMEDLLCKFQAFSKDLQVCIEPCVMDIKMGTRTFLEKEVSSPTVRSDLYDKMVKIDPNAATKEEHEVKSVTKLRYMTFRESLSSSSQLGFRIEGVKVTKC